MQNLRNCLSVNNVFVGILFAIFVFQSRAQPAPDRNSIDYRATTRGKLEAARQVIKSMIDDDFKIAQHFGKRPPPWVIADDQAGYDCGSIKVIARAIEVEQPYFNNPDATPANQRIAIVPVRAEILMIETNGEEGGKKSPMNFKVGGDCGFEYERWSFVNRRYEKIPGFRSRNHDEEFVNWGESVSEVGRRPKRFIAVDFDKRYVRFVTRVRVSSPVPYQLSPQFPVHFNAQHSLSLMIKSDSERSALLELGRSDRDPSAFGLELANDLTRISRQRIDTRWKIEKIERALERLKDINPFEEIRP